ncbi:hypothetical protein N7508_000759 [Penicillium antarcticum]|nr:uncharacterized protein N7508_000759 [Penicillium antarcticum]KAJ5320476.1 hypothetical protein N7508_000759 [Penicillium antarcticum]
MSSNMEASEMSLPFTRKLVATHLPLGQAKNILDLPNEILQQVASLLSTDQDVLHLSQTCKAIWAQIYAPESALWRTLFANRYDVLSLRPSNEFRNEYLIRAIILGAKFHFAEKEDDRQNMCMEVMKTMLEEVITVHLKAGCPSKTLDRLRVSLSTMDFLKCPQKNEPSERFFALQLAMTPLALDSTITRACHRDDYNLATIYSFGEQLGMPFIGHNDLNLERVLQMRSFWQRHLLTESELTYHETFASLPAHLKPGVRKVHAKDLSELSTSWLGLYSCLHPLPDSLEELTDLNRQTCADLEDHADAIEVMTLKVKSQPDVEVFWPEVCTMIAPPVGPATGRTYFQGKQMIHENPGEEDNTVFGFTEDIEVTFGGIGGWKRICFTICQGDTSTDFGSKMAGDDWVHCYEALIIPGGRAMLGRWVDAKNETGRGPFIFWDL